MAIGAPNVLGLLIPKVLKSISKSNVFGPLKYFDLGPLNYWGRAQGPLIYVIIIITYGTTCQYIQCRRVSPCYPCSEGGPHRVRPQPPGEARGDC